MTLTDTHCHLDFSVFDEDRDQVLERAREAGVVRILNPGIDLPTSRAAIELAESQSVVYAAVGVHPNEALTWQSGHLNQLRALTESKRVVAIGEIGLDYYRERTPHPLQKQVFRMQLDLAAEAKLPVILHLRNAGRDERQASLDMFEILRDWHENLVTNQSPLANNPGVFHSFFESEAYAKIVQLLNFKIGITGPITFQKSQDLVNLVASIPIDNLVVETDAPYQTPHPQRGRRNEPAYVRLIVEKIAEIQHESYDKIANKTTANAKQLFHW